MERLEAIVRGKVQMVAYRAFAERAARSLFLCGEVRNLPDGTVRVVAEGERASLEKLLKKLRKGPLFARVEDVDARWLSPTEEYETFDIRYE